MPSPPQSQQHFAGSRFPASSRQRESQFSDSATAERRAWAATRWQHGRARQTCPQPAAVVSDQSGFTSEFGCFCPLQCSLRNGGGAEMADLTIIADCLGRAEPRGLMRVLVGRSLATNRRNRIAILLVHVGRSLATSCWCFLGAPDLRPVSSVCGRRNEAIALRRCLRIAAVEWSGLQSWRVRPGRGRNSADTCHERFRGSVGSVKPGLLFCAAIAALPISFLPRSGHLFFSCLTLAP